MREPAESPCILKSGSTIMLFLNRSNLRGFPSLPRSVSTGLFLLLPQAALGPKGLILQHSNPASPLSAFQMGFFRRRYKEIIEAEKNRKENEDSWDWVQKNQ